MAIVIGVQTYAFRGRSHSDKELLDQGPGGRRSDRANTRTLIVAAVVHIGWREGVGMGPTASAKLKATSSREVNGMYVTVQIACDRGAMWSSVRVWTSADDGTPARWERLIYAGEDPRWTLTKAWTELEQQLVQAGLVEPGSMG
jgi:hypothetical protein